MDADVIIVGAGLAGLVAAREAHRSGLRTIIIEQESEQNLGGQAWWSFGGLFLVDSPEQRRFGIHDSFDLAWQDWKGSAAWDRLDGPDAEDFWARQWGKAYVEFAAGEKRAFLRELGIDLTPIVGWAERGDLRPQGHGNSVPRFHIPWGTGTGVVRPFIEDLENAVETQKTSVLYRHQLDEIIVTDGKASGVRGSILVDTDSPRGALSSREIIRDFELHANQVVITTGGIGGNHELVRKHWPKRLGEPPQSMVTGVPAYVDGRGIGIAHQAGARLVNQDRMWHYTEGVKNWAPVWPGHAIRILPGPSPLWLDAIGRRLPLPGLPGHDTLGTLKLLRTDPLISQYDHSWFIVTSRMAAKEFALSGSEQNPDLTNRDKKLLLKTRLGGGPPGPVQAFIDYGPDWVSASTVEKLVSKMNKISPEAPLSVEQVKQSVLARDAEIVNKFTKDAQVMSIKNSRSYLGDRLTRTTTPHQLLEPKAGPLVAIKLHVLTRKSLGGIQTDLHGHVVDLDGTPIAGLFAAGEAAGFGGGGVHGYNALEGTFLGGCIFSGLQVGRSLTG